MGKYRNVRILYSPVSDRVVSFGDICQLDEGKQQIRCGGTWFDFDDRWGVVDEGTGFYLNKKHFVERAEELINDFEDLLQRMPQKGNSTNECQRVTIQQAINELSYTINGITDDDFLPNVKY